MRVLGPLTRMKKLKLQVEKWLAGVTQARAPSQGWLTPVYRLWSHSRLPTFSRRAGRTLGIPDPPSGGRPRLVVLWPGVCSNYLLALPYFLNFASCARILISFTEPAKDPRNYSCWGCNQRGRELQMVLWKHCWLSRPWGGGSYWHLAGGALGTPHSAQDGSQPSHHKE